MRCFVFDRDLAAALFPGRTLVSLGSHSSADRVLAFQSTGDAGREHAALKAAYADAVLLQKSPNGADASVRNWAEACDFAVSRRGLAQSKKMRSWFESAQDEEALSALKLSLALGRWDRDCAKRSGKVYRLYDAVSKGRREDVVEDASPDYAAACLLSFCERALEGPGSGTSDWMKQALERAKKACDFSLEALWPLDCDPDVPCDASVLAAVLAVSRCW